MSRRVHCNQCINSPRLLEIPLPQSRVLLITMVIDVSNRVIQSESKRLCYEFNSLNLRILSRITATA